jgi:hypothetical protein
MQRNLSLRTFYEVVILDVSQFTPDDHNALVEQGGTIYNFYKFIYPGVNQKKYLRYR